MMLNKDQEHCSWAVKVFEDHAFEYLEKEVGLKTMCITEFTENCTAQYKSHAPFHIIPGSLLVLSWLGWVGLDA